MQITKGSTGVSLYFLTKTAIIWNAPGLKARFTREQGQSTAIPLKALTSHTDPHNVGMFGETYVNSCLHRLDVPDAAFAVGAPRLVVVEIFGITDMQPLAQIIGLE